MSVASRTNTGGSEMVGQEISRCLTGHSFTDPLSHFATSGRYTALSAELASCKALA
jgi:hypothetical protein